MKTMINKVDTLNWQEFQYKDVFCDITRGLRLVENDRVSGDIPYYSASEKNNALTGSVANPLFIEKDALIYTTFGDCFYVSGEFTASDEISIFKHPRLNIYTGLFLATIVQTNKHKYAFGRKAFHYRYSSDYLTLPAKYNSKNKYEPDWQFMEDYIKCISKKVDFSDAIQFSNRALRPVKKESFQEFRLLDVFIIERGMRLTKLNQISGEIAYISSTKENNGIDDYITPPEHMKIYQNALTLNNSGSVGYCFYHPYPFVVSDHCMVLSLKDEKIILNTYIALFLKSILEKMRPRYSFGREINNERLNNEFINLPAKYDSNHKHEPDWQFMEDYIKSLPYSSSL